MQKTDSGGGSGGTDYVAGEGINISGDEISIDSTVVALKADKTKVVESSINGNVKVDSSEVQVYRLPTAYEEYLARATYKLPTIATLQVVNAAGKSVGGNYEVGSSVEVTAIKHKETDSQNISGNLTIISSNLTISGMSITPSDELATVKLATSETLTSNKTYTLSGVSTLNDRISKSASVTFTEYAYSKLSDSEDAPTSSLKKESAISTFANSGSTFAYAAGQYLYLYTNAAGKKVKSEILGQWADVNFEELGATTITQANGAKRSYYAYRVGPFMASGSAKYRV